MPIQITIEGSNAMSLLSELKILTEALSPQEPPFDTGMSKAKELAEKGMNEASSYTKTEKGEIVENVEVKEVKAEKPKTKRTKTKKAKSEEPKVEEVKVTKVEETKDEADDIAEAYSTLKEADVKITPTMISELIKKKCKDESGIDIPAKYSEATKIFSKFVPKGKPVMISSISIDSYKELYKELQSL